MTTLRIALLISLLGSGASLACAEDITISTYYPSPRGVYQELRTTNNTYLATQAGNVGIGTTGPAGKLHVVNSLDAGVLVLGDDPMLTTNSQRGLQFLTHSNGNLYIDAKTYSGGTINFRTGEGTETGYARTWMTVDPANGNVGIGTTNPGTNAKFEVNGTGAPDYALFSDFTTATLRIGNDGGGNVRLRTDGAQNLVLSPGGAERMRITTAGAIGIGTTGPGAKLSVTNGTSFVNIGQLAENPTYAGLSFDASSAPVAAASYSLIGNGVNTLLNRPPGGIIDFRENNASQMTILSGGNVGIGTTGPAERLDVWGNIRATGTIRADSDARFKQDLQPLSGILPKLESLHSLAYTPSPLGQARGMSPGRQLGVLGQELEQVFPELVSASGPEQYRSVDYSRLSVVLLEAIKELKQEVDVLKRENEALRRDLGPSKQPAKTEF